MKKYTNFNDEIEGTYGQANFGTFMWQTFLSLTLILVGIGIYQLIKYLYLK